MTDTNVPAPIHADTLRPWQSPEVRTIRAGSAEAGPNPNAPEGGFARGS